MNKLVLGKVGFNYPIFLTFINYVVSWLLMVVLNALSMLPASPAKSSRFSSLFALGVVMSLSTGLANVSLKYNSVGFYQMAKIAVTPSIVVAEFILLRKRVSFQRVTFATRESVPPEFSRTLHYGNVTYNLYSNSLLHFGQNVAFDSLKELLVSGGVKLATGSPLKELTIDPCTPKGYSENDVSSNLLPGSFAQRYASTFHAKGNFSECRAATLTLLQKGKENCSYQHCTLGSTFVPKLHGRFLATENFF